MSLPQLRRFWEHCEEHCRRQGGLLAHPGTGELVPLKRASTWLIVEAFVKGLTRHGERPLVDAMEEFGGEGGPSRVTYFVSHAWRCPFYDILQQLEEMGGGGVFWLDCFACSQNGDQDGSRLELLSDPDVFARAMGARDTLAQVLCLDSRASPLTRLWIIYEIVKAHEAGKELLVPSPQRVERGYGSINWDRTSCTVERDRQYIMEQVDSIGRDEVSQVVRDSLLRAYHRRADDASLQYGDDSFEHAKAANELGNMLVDAGDFTSAKKRHEMALNILVQRFGDGDLNAAKARANLGGDLNQLGRPPAAQQELEAALKIQRRHFGDNHPEVALTRTTLGLVLLQLGRLPEAQQELVTALKIQRRHFEDDHPEVASARANLGAVLMQLGRLPEAQQELEAALKIQRRHLGDDHLEVASTRAILGLVLMQLCRLPEAQQELEAVLKIQRRHFGDDHPKVAPTRATLGLVLLALGRLPEAQHELETAVKIQRRHLGDDHPEVARLRGLLGSLR